MAHRARPLAKISALGFLTLTAPVALSSCGGSASETPPPLEPHPANLHYSRSSTALSEADLPPEPESSAGPAPAPASPPEFRAPPPGGNAPAPRTWGAEPDRKGPALK